MAATDRSTTWSPGSRADGIADLVALAERIAALDGRRRTSSGTPGLAVLAASHRAGRSRSRCPSPSRPSLHSMTRRRCPASWTRFIARGLLCHRPLPRTSPSSSSGDGRWSSSSRRPRRGGPDLARPGERRAAPSAPSRQPGPSPDRHAHRRHHRLPPPRPTSAPGSSPRPWLASGIWSGRRASRPCWLPSHRAFRRGGRQSRSTHR
jgi:hypothetical protein